MYNMPKILSKIVPLNLSGPYCWFPTAQEPIKMLHKQAKKERVRTVVRTEQAQSISYLFYGKSKNSLR